MTFFHYLQEWAEAVAGKRGKNTYVESQLDRGVGQTISHIICCPIYRLKPISNLLLFIIIGFILVGWSLARILSQEATESKRKVAAKVTK